MPNKNVTNIGVIGGICDGKRTLTAAIVKSLAKKDLSTNKNCKRIFQNITCQNNNEREMICNLAMMDGVILVVDATSGPMPQTRDYILYSLQVGISNMVVFINKCDIANDNEIVNSEIWTRDLLNEYGFDGDNILVVYGSATEALEGDIKYEQAVIDLIDIVDSWSEISTKEHKTIKDIVDSWSEKSSQEHKTLNKNDDILIKTHISKLISMIGTAKTYQYLEDVLNNSQTKKSKIKTKN